MAFPLPTPKKKKKNIDMIPLILENATATNVIMKLWFVLEMSTQFFFLFFLFFIFKFRQEAGSVSLLQIFFQ